MKTKERRHQWTNLQLIQATQNHRRGDQLSTIQIMWQKFKCKWGIHAINAKPIKMYILYKSHVYQITYFRYVTNL
jgi:hypothetical protein